MLPEGSVAVALVSGGADSTALLRLLAAGELGALAELSVLHIDHRLRGADSDADAAFVADLCASLGVECRVARYDVSAYAAAEGLNLEDAGRRVRYRFAEDEADARCDALGVPRGAGRVLTAHTRDDALETFLIRMVTGSGSGALALPPVRGRVVRPLLEARRADVVAYLTSLRQAWREDATNADTTRLRARVRAELVPLAESINPRFSQTLARLVTVLGDEDRLLAGMADALAADLSSSTDGEVRFDRRLMATLSPAMARRTVRAAVLAAFPEASRLEFDHVEAIVYGLTDDGFSRDLPEGLRAFTEYATLVVARMGEEVAPEPALLEVPGSAGLGGRGEMRAAWADPGDVPTGSFEVLVDAGRLTGGPLVVDGPRDGDRFRPLGMSGTKKLQDLLVDEKIPRRLRAGVPVVRDGGKVVWVAGVRIGESVKVTPETVRALRLTWSGGREWLRRGKDAKDAS